MSLSGSSVCRNRSCAITVFATESSMAVPIKMILSFKSLEYMSYALSERPVCSITMGITLTLFSFLQFRFREYKVEHLLLKQRTLETLQGSIPGDIKLHDLFW